jgi:hypothetical protein
MKISPAMPHENPIISADTVPACEGTRSWAITTFTGIVKSRMNPPNASPSRADKPDARKNSARKGTDPIMEARITFLPPNRSARCPPMNPPIAPAVR